MSRRRYVLGFLFSQDETRIALIRKTRPAWQAGRLNAIGGHAEEGETFNQAMQREAQEELGEPLLTWRRFATVESLRFEDTNVLNEEPWVMACYRCQDDGAIAHLPSHNDVDEAFETHDVDFLYDPDFTAGETVNNLRWLVAMAMSRQEKDWPFHVREQHYVGDDDV